jgi:serine/threonine protein kinase
MFQMLAGHRPFEGEPHEVMRMVLIEPPPPLQRASPAARARPALDAWFQRAMAKEPADRFSSAELMGDTLAGIPDPLLLPGEAANNLSRGRILRSKETRAHGKRVARPS